MSYAYRNTTKVNANLYIEDRGYEYQVKRGDADFATVDGKFGAMLSVGQTAVHNGMDAEGFDIVNGFPMLDQAKAVKMEEVNKKCQIALSQITNSYPANECLTFDQQKAEAQAFLADPNAECPMLHALAQSRGIAMAELARRVLAKAAAFSAASGRLMGQRQAYEDLIDTLKTPGEVTAIVVKYN